MGLMVGFSVSIYAADYIVDTAIDPLYHQNYTDMSLRRAVGLANNQTGKSTITFKSNLVTINLDGPLTIRGDVTINGKNQIFLVCNNCSAFLVDGGSLFLKNLIVHSGSSKGGNGGVGLVGWGGGAAGMGGGLFVNKGKADCEKVSFINCKAIGGNGGYFSGNIMEMLYDHPNGGGGGGMGHNGETSTASAYGKGGNGGILGGLGGGQNGNTSLNGGEGAGGGGGESGDGNFYAGHGGFGGGGGGGLAAGNGGFGGGAGGCSWVKGSPGEFGGQSYAGYGGGGAGLGGAIFVRANADLSMVDCFFWDNEAKGGEGGYEEMVIGIQGYGGQGKGGAIFIMSGATASMKNCTFFFDKASNSANTVNHADSFHDTHSIYGVMTVFTGEGSTAFPSLSSAADWMFYE